MSEDIQERKERLYAYFVQKVQETYESFSGYDQPLRAPSQTRLEELADLLVELYESEEKEFMMRNIMRSKAISTQIWTSLDQLQSIILIMVKMGYFELKNGNKFKLTKKAKKLVKDYLDKTKDIRKKEDQAIADAKAAIAKRIKTDKRKGTKGVGRPRTQPKGTNLADLIKDRATTALKTEIIDKYCDFFLFYWMILPKKRFFELKLLTRFTQAALKNDQTKSVTENLLISIFSKPDIETNLKWLSRNFDKLFKKMKKLDLITFSDYYENFSIPRPIFIHLKKMHE